MAPGRHTALAATPLNRGDSARASQAKPKCSAITGHRTACTVPPTSLTTQFQFSRQQIDDQVQARSQSPNSLPSLSATARSVSPISLTTPTNDVPEVSMNLRSAIVSAVVPSSPRAFAKSALVTNLLSTSQTSRERTQAPPCVLLGILVVVSSAVLDGSPSRWSNRFDEYQRAFGG